MSKNSFESLKNREGLGTREIDKNSIKIDDTLKPSVRAVRKNDELRYIKSVRDGVGGDCKCELSCEGKLYNDNEVKCSGGCPALAKKLEKLGKKDK